MRPFIQDKIDAAVLAATTPLKEGLEVVAENTGVSLAPPDPAGAGVPSALTVDQRLEAQRIAITGQITPPPPTGWPMSNNRSAKRLDLVEPDLASLRVEVDTLRDVTLQGLADVTAVFSLLNSQRQLDLAEIQVERARNDLQDAKDELQDAALAQLAAADRQAAALNELQSAQIEQQRLDTLALAARQTATEKKQAADELDIAALKASDANQTAQLLAQATGIEADRLLALAAQATADQAKNDAKVAKDAAAAAQTRADQAEADAQAAKSLANTAQATANTAATGLVAANARIDAVAANVTTVQAVAAAAQTTATSAQAAVAALADRGRVLLGIATPASAGLLGIGGTLTVPLTWTKAFPGTAYAGSFLRTSGGTAAMGVSLTNKTPTSCTLVLTLTGTVSLAVPAGTGDVVLTYSS